MADLQRRIQAMEKRCFHKIVHMSCKDHITNDEAQSRIKAARDFLTTIKKCKLKWYGYVTCSAGLAKTILQGHCARKKKKKQTVEELGGQHQVGDRLVLRQVPDGSHGLNDLGGMSHISGTPITHESRDR